MTKEEKINKILGWYSEVNIEETKHLSRQDNFLQVDEIEKLTGEVIPKDIRDFFEKYDGESGNGYGSFFGHSFVSLSEMKSSLNFAKTQIKLAKVKTIKPTAIIG